MIYKTSISGFFIKDEIAVEIANFLEDYNSILKERLKDELDQDVKNQVMEEKFNIDIYCKILRGEK